MFKLTTFPSWGSVKNINKTLQNLNIIYLETHTHIIICREWWERYMSDVYIIYKNIISHTTCVLSDTASLQRTRVV